MRAIGDHHQLVFIRAETHQRRCRPCAIGNFQSGDAYPAVIGGFPGTAGFVAVNLALGVHHQAVHVLVGRDIHRTAARLITVGKTVEEQLIRTLDGIDIDDLQGFRIEGDHLAPDGIEHQEAVEGHANSEVEIAREVRAALDLLVFVHPLRQHANYWCAHTRFRVFRIELINAENLPTTGTDEGILTGQQ
ncbi:hypothetical protein D9M69_536120 [compost metagenome]